MIRIKFSLLFLLTAGLLAAGCSKSDDTTSATNGPTINSFTVTPSAINAGDSTVLKWDVSGATSITIDNGVGNESSNTDNQVTIFPGDTTTYTLTAKNSSGTSTAQAKVFVNNPGEAGSPPKPAGLTATAGASTPSTISLSWTA